MEPEPKGPAQKLARRRKTAKQTIGELKDILQSRVEHLKAEIDRLSAETAEIGTSREMGVMAAVTRTLNTVLQMERKERDHRTAKAKQRRTLNAARRVELSRRLDELCAAPAEEGAGDETER
jgi:hypothetical protein